MKQDMQLPLLALRGFVVFPGMVMNFDVGRKKSVKAIEKAMVENQKIFLAVQKKAIIEEPTIDEIGTIGTIARIKQIIKIQSGVVKVLVEGIERAEIVNYDEEEPFFNVSVKVNDKKDVDDNYKNALIRMTTKALEDYNKINKHIAPDTLVELLAEKDPAKMADAIASNVFFTIDEKINLLNELNPITRLEHIIILLQNEVDIAKVQKELELKVKNKINKNQKEYFLREQLKIIQDSLGDESGIKGEVKKYSKKLEKLDLPEYVEKRIKSELDRMAKMSYNSSELTVIRNYVECILSLPFNKSSDESKDLKLAKKILNEDHYGLDKVKERILEYVAVRKMSSNMYCPILCFVGPPGVGKTSIVRSIARSINREYVRISLGGVRDESEIRGHRKTYVGSMPGRIINGLIKAKVDNPVMLLDEIDKMNSDLRGDPTAALLEVLDPEQNKYFVDHYVDLQVDLSKVMFIATANTLQSIPRPLLDRLEIIHISSYTEDEKLRIAQDYLVTKQLKKHGLKKGQLRFNEDVLKVIISNYTRESGVRGLERKIAEACRKSVKQLLTENRSYIKLTSKNIKQYLGAPIYHYDKIQDKAMVGIARGLAWTVVGGDTLSIEVNVMKGSGKFELTGQLGDVMKESAKAAISYIRSEQKELGINGEFYKDTDIHIHIPEGAVPKDGPSAGITMATAMISALTEKPVRNDVSMTGEVTIRGRVLPIGGLKEKLLAAKRVGIKSVLIPYDNKKDFEELEDKIVKGLEIHLVKNMKEVLEYALLKEE